MIRSMTGFGTGRGAEGGEAFDLEARSVNHKFCEVKVRLPRDLAALEVDLARTVRDRLARGGIEIALRRSSGRPAFAPRVDADLAERYARAFQEIEGRLELERGLTLSDLLAAEGVVSLEEAPADLGAARRAALQALDVALGSLCAMRLSEGEALTRDLAGRLEAIERLVGRVEANVPVAVEHVRARLSERVLELTRGLPLDPARLAQEVALFADRTDVSEEVTRLRSHAAQARALIQGEEPAGRKLEFLVQEMHREANTIGSKSQSAEISAAVVELKAEIERIREQVQNVE